MDNNEMKQTPATAFVVAEKTNGSIVTDGLSKELNGRVDDLIKANEQNGILKGRINVLENELYKAEEELAKAEKQVIVTVKPDTKSSSISLEYDPWTSCWKEQKSSILETKTINLDSITELANNTVLDKANEKVKKAEKQVESIKEEMEELEKDLKRREDKLDKTIERAITNETNNLKSELTEVKNNLKENEAIVTDLRAENSLLRTEMEIITKAFNKEIDRLTELNTLLNKKSKNIVKTLRAFHINAKHGLFLDFGRFRRAREKLYGGINNLFKK